MISTGQPLHSDVSSERPTIAAATHIVSRCSPQPRHWRAPTSPMHPMTRSTAPHSAKPSSVPDVTSPHHSPPRHPRLVELSSPNVLEPLFDFISAPSVPPSLTDAVHSLLAQRVRITRNDSLPVSPISSPLAGRVAVLEAQATTLSEQVAKARIAALSPLHAALRARSAELATLPEQSRSITHRPIRCAGLAEASVRGLEGVCERIGVVKKEAESTKRRAASVREVLRIISENGQGDVDVTQEMADDWTETFGDLPRGKRRASIAKGGFGTPESPIPVFRRNENDENRIFLPISPHITPRSKLRKRIARTSGQEPRKMSFSPGSLPR